MGDNATEGIYIAVYIFIFIVALSATITMFYMINNYAELSYEYGKNVENSGTLIENVPTTTYRVITGSEVISYYFNYIKSQSSSALNFNIEVLNEKGNRIFNQGSFNGTYAEVVKLVDPAALYYLEYDSVEESATKTTVNIKIKKATQDEINKIQV